MTALKYILITIGLGWALLGVANVVMVAGRGDEAMSAFALVFNAVAFIFPGLICAGIGGLQRTHK